MRMLQTCGQADFALEAVRPESERELRKEHLERDRAIMPRIVREIDGRHPATPELALDAIPPAERCDDLFEHDEPAKRTRVNVGTVRGAARQVRARRSPPHEDRSVMTEKHQ